MSPREIAEDRDLPHRALELLETGATIGSPADEDELRAAERDVASAVDTISVVRLGEGAGSVYAYGYKCAPGRLKIGRTDRDVVGRIVNQINESTPDRPVLHLVLATNNPGALERALHGALVLRDRKVKGGGEEWFRASVDEILTIYHALLGEPAIPSAANHP